MSIGGTKTLRYASPIFLWGVIGHFCAAMVPAPDSPARVAAAAGALWRKISSKIAASSRPLRSQE